MNFFNFENEDLDVFERDESTRTQSEETASLVSITPFQPYEDESLSKKTKPGRKKLNTNLILAALRTKSGKALNKQDIRSQAIRREKKLLRQLRSKRFTRKSRIQYDLKTQSEALLWIRLKEIYVQNSEILTQLSDASLDHFSYRKNEETTQFPQSTEYQSYSAQCCRSFYSHPAIREFHYFYILLTYGACVTDPTAMCEKFQLQCCAGLHVPDCIKAWENLRQYLLETMIKELDLHTFQEDEKGYKKPKVPDYGSHIPMIEDQDFYIS